MTQGYMAGYLGIDTKTLRNWRKNKPNLYAIVMKGFAFDEMVKLQKENYEKAKEIQNKYKGVFEK